MKRFSILLISIFLIQSFSFSQTVIDFNAHAPQEGDAVNFIEIPFFDPSQGGKDMVWDFSNVKLLEKKVISQQLNPEKSNADKFSITPNMLLNEDNKFHYFTLNENSFNVVGVITDNYELVYDKPIKRMSYPFMYEGYFEGDFAGKAVYNTNYHIDITGIYKVEADAYGLLILPGNCIKNVIRVKQHTSSNQVSMCSVVNVDTYKYVWYSYDERYPLLSVIITEQRYSNGEFKLIQEAYISENALTCKDEFALTNIEENQSMFNYSVFPNPFKNDISINYQLNKDFNVSIGIYDIVGKMVKDVVLSENQNEGIYTYTIAASDIGLTPGMYFIKFEFGDKVVVEKIIRSH